MAMKNFQGLINKIASFDFYSGSVYLDFRQMYILFTMVH